VLSAVASSSRRLVCQLGLASLLLYPCVARGQPSASEPTAGSTSDVEVESHIHRGYPAVRLTDVGGALGIELPVDGIRATGTLVGGVLELRAGSSFVRYADRVYQLTNPAYVHAGSFWVPIELLTRWMGPVTGIAWQQRDGWVALLGRGEGPAGGAAAAGDPVAAGPGGPNRPNADARRPGPWRVVIDAGHGGKDPGAIGYKGLREKDVTLAIARNLYDRLAREPDFEPILTRDRDRFISLMERPRVAIVNDADLFISIHGNSISNRKTRGFETYFLGEARSEEAKRVAIRENSVIEFEDPATRPKPDAMDYILTSLRQNMNVSESRHFAGVAQNSLRSAFDTRDRGVKQAGYWVLVGASGSMPAVLVEVGFITNASEAGFLRSSKGQDRIAGTLAEAVRQYFANYRERLMAAGGSS
jgi:N-acetylmuramoyl-L-alanine amidase